MTDKPLREALDDWPEPEGSFDEVLERAVQDRFGQPGPTLTASEVKVLTETALRLGRKEAGDEIAETLEALGDSIGEGNQRELLADLADIARDIGSSPLGATWDVRSGVPGHPEVSEAVRSPQKPCGHPTCPCAQEAR